MNGNPVGDAVGSVKTLAPPASAWAITLLKTTEPPAGTLNGGRMRLLVFGIAAAWAIAKFDFRGKNVLITLIDLHRNKTGIIAPHVIITPYVVKGFKAYYDDQKTQPLSEGIVMKRLDSTLRGGGNNPGWFKIRYR